MMVKVYATLRQIVPGGTIEINDAPQLTVSDMLSEVVEQYPALHEEIFEDNGDLDTSIHVFVNGRNVLYLDGVETVITPQDSIRIFPPVGGG